MPRYRFTGFTISPRRRLLLHADREVPLIPRYFDLLVFLIERRHEAVHRREIFEHVWSDVIVSDSALSQAIRTLRRTLGDDPRDPKFIRTVSRHGYRFVCPDVIEEEDADLPSASVPIDSPASIAGSFDALLERLTGAGDGDDLEDRREAAELLHVAGTAEALARLGTRPGHILGRALLRDTRWDAATGDRVPILGAPQPFAVARTLVALRLRRAARVVARRWTGACVGGGVAGLAGGVLGGLILAATPGSRSPWSVAAVLGVIGAACGAAGGAGVGAGLSAAEVSTRSRREAALVAGAALGGGAVGLVTELVARWSLSALVDLQVPIGGALEGLTIGAAAGLGYALATQHVDGMAAPRGRRRLRAAGLTALLCGSAALALAAAGRPLVGGTIHAIATAAHSSAAVLTPLGRLIGEPHFGPVSQRILGFGEGALFGLGLTLGLTHRPAAARSRKSQQTLTAG